MSKAKFNRSISKLDFGIKIKTCDMHTCGEPVRIIESLSPSLIFPENSTVLEKRRLLQSEYDYVRRMSILEPRGHKDMFGAMLTDPNHDTDSDFGLIFLNNEGYGTMCGHATIGVSRYLIEKGLILPNIGETEIKLDCPCGQIKVWVEFDGEKVGRSRFLNVPAFVQQFDCIVEVEELNRSVKFDISFGGNFFAIVEANELGIDFKLDPTEKIVDRAMRFRRKVDQQIPLYHPTNSALEHLFGVIITDSLVDLGSSNIFPTLCVFGVNACDRSPCGSGTTALVATKYFRNQIQLNDEVYTQNALLGSKQSQFRAVPIEEINIEGRDGQQYQSIIVEISSRANFIGESVMTFESDDYFKYGFQL